MKKNIIYNFLLTGSNLLFPLLTFPYLSRILGVQGMGICNFIISYGQNYLIIAALGIPVYGIREIAKVGEDKIKRSKLFFEILTLHFLFTCFLLILYVISIFTYHDLLEYKYLAFLGGSLILFNVFSIEWLFTGVSDFKYITIRSVVIRALSVIAIFLLVKKSNDFLIYFIILVTTVFATACLDIYYSRKFITRKVGLSAKGIASHIKPVALLGVYMVLTSIYSVLPTTLLGFLSTKSAVGYYYGANKIIRMVISFFSALITVMIPKLNLAVEQKRENEFVSLINKALSTIITFGIPITFFVFLLAQPIIMLLAGQNFFNSIALIKIMAPIILIVAFAQVFVLLILSVHRKDMQMVMLSMTGMTISIMINLLFIPYFAEKATAFSQLLSEFIVILFAFFFAKRILSFHFPVREFLINVLCVIPFAAFIHLSIQLFDNNSSLIIVFSAFLCGLHFLLYQFFILKNKLVLEVVEKFSTKFLGRSLAFRRG